MGNLLLHTAAGAGEGLERVLAREREQELMRQRALMQEAQIRDINSGISTRESTTARLNEGADIVNRGAMTKFEALRRIADAAGEDAGAMPGTPVDMSLPGQRATPPAPREFSGLSRLNTPEGRTLFQTAGLNPNESFGSVPQPPTPKTLKGPEDLTAEETFYTGMAKKAGYPDYKTWAGDHPDQMAKARHAWAEQGFSPIQMSTPIVQVGDPNTGRTVYQTRDAAIGQPGPLPAGEKDRIAAYNATLDLIDEIERTGDKVGWKGLGPIAGRVGAIGKEYLGVGSDDEEALRNKVNQLKAAASFQEGGKQFTGTEKQMLDAFLAGVNQNPSAVKDRLRSFRESAIRSLESLGASRQRGATTPGPGNKPGGTDLYQEYLNRTRKPGGGGQ